LTPIMRIAASVMCKSLAGRGSSFPRHARPKRVLTKAGDDERLD
jgi:hypothetical protein